MAPSSKNKAFKRRVPAESRQVADFQIVGRPNLVDICWTAKPGGKSGLVHKNAPTSQISLKKLPGWIQVVEKYYLSHGFWVSRVLSRILRRNLCSSQGFGYWSMTRVLWYVKHRSFSSVGDSKPAIYQPLGLRVWVQICPNASRIPDFCRNFTMFLNFWTPKSGGFVGILLGIFEPSGPVAWDGGRIIACRLSSCLVCRSLWVQDT